MKDKGHLAFLEQSFQRDFFALLILQLEGWCLRTDVETRNLLPQTGRRHGKSNNQRKEATPGNSLHGNFVSPKKLTHHVIVVAHDERNESKVGTANRL